MAAQPAEPFLTADGGLLRPGPPARSWWAEGKVHGRVLGGLLARQLEAEHAEPGLRFGRLSVDLFRAADMGPLRVETARPRDGKRIRVADATVLGEDGPVARASAVLLADGEQPAGAPAGDPAWDAPPPDALESAPGRTVAEGAAWDMWFIGDDGGPRDGWSRSGRARAWLRDGRELIGGEPLSPFVRVALAADAASPVAHIGAGGLQFINADFTLVLGRLPVGEHIGFAGDGHVSSDGVAAGRSTLHDTAGPIGFAVTTALANPRPRG